MIGRSFLLAGLVLCLAVPVRAQDNPRITETTRLVQKCLPAVVSLPMVTPGEKPGTQQVHFGSGTVISPSGYVLTNAHVVRNSKEGPALFTGNRVLKYQTICTIPHSDLAVLKLQTESQLVALPIGRSHDLMLGEPTLVIGNAGELAHSASTGIVSGLARSTRTEQAILPDVIQTSAAINGGNSGGPLINALGEMIGVVSSKKQNADNVGFAIAADHVRVILPAVLKPEERYNFWFGATADPLASNCHISDLAAGSPAAEAGLQRGDILRRVNGQSVNSAIDLALALIDLKAGQVITLVAVREGKPMGMEVELKPLPLPEPVKDENFVNGLQRKEYAGQWPAIPDFASLMPVAEKVVEKVVEEKKLNYAFQFRGFLKVAEEGLYSFVLRSDDGSRLRIANKLIADNDGPHAIRDVTGVIRLPTGLHPIDVEYFQGTGETELKLFWEGPGITWQEVPKEVLFVKKEEEAKE
jgi:S1-C subfamily serine protease